MSLFKFIEKQIEFNPDLQLFYNINYNLVYLDLSTHYKMNYKFFHSEIFFNYLYFQEMFDKAYTSKEFDALRYKIKKISQNADRIIELNYIEELIKRKKWKPIIEENIFKLDKKN